MELRLIFDTIPEEFDSFRGRYCPELFEKLWERIQEVYDKEFHPTEEYTQHIDYHAADKYGYADFQTYIFKKERVYTADEFCASTATHCTHLALPEPYRTRFFDGVRKAINDFGGKITSYDSHVLYAAKKPE